MCNKLYRFRRWERDSSFAIDIIENKRLFLSMFNEQEDENELDAILIPEQEVGSECEFFEDDKEVNTYNERREKRLALESLCNYEREIRRQNTIGCSFTKEISDYMWENYGDDSTGVCFAFNVFKHNIGELIPVRYCEESDREIHYEIGEECRNLHPDRIKQTLFALKGNRFSEEKEIRYVVDRNLIAEDTDGGYYLYLNETDISEIYAGENMSNRAFAELCEIVARYLPDVKVKKWQEE